MIGGDGIGIKNLELALSRRTEVALDTGMATGGGNTTLDDATKGWTVNQWVTGLSVIQIVKPDGTEYFRIISANTATQITFAALPVGVVAAAGDLYSVRIIGGGVTDITDRWNRQLGQIDLARVLGAVLAHGNPVITRITDGGAFIDPRDVSDRAARVLGVITSLTQWAGVALTGRDISLDLAKLDITLSNQVKRQRWGREVDPTWTHADEVVAPVAGTALVTQAVTAGKTGYIYGFFATLGEGNDIKINWTSGAAAKSVRLTFSGKSSLQYIDQAALNEGLGADGGTNVTITNVNAGGAGIIYQARLFYAEV